MCERLLIYLSSPAGLIEDESVNSWIPTPSELEEYDKNNMLYVWGSINVCALGARAYERIGRDDEAAEIAQVRV